LLEKYLNALITLQHDRSLQKLQLSIAVISLIALLLDALIVRAGTLLAPYIRSNLQIDKSQYGFVLSALMVGTLIAVIPLNNLLRRVSTRHAFGVMMGVIAAGLLVVASQVTFPGLIIALFLLGIPRACLVPLVNRVIAENYDPAKRGSITGLLFAAVPLGGFLGALILPVLSEAFFWGAGYGLLAAVALAGGIISWFLLPNAAAPFKSSRSVGLKFLRSKAFIILGLTYGIFSLSLTTEVFITLYLVDVVKISALLAGTFFGLIQLTGIGGRVFWGILADRYFSKNRWWLLAFTNGLTVLSSILLITLSQGSPYWIVILTMVGFGLSAASSWGILSTLVGDIVPVNSVATATASVFFLTSIADSGGPVLFSSLLRLTGSYERTISIFLGIAVLTTISFGLMAAQNLLRQSKA
jgi:MFS family permease